MKPFLAAFAVLLVLAGLGEWAARRIDWSGTRVMERNPEWYRTDAAGFRQPPSPLGSLPSGQIRIVVLSGDETWGPGVQAKDLWTVQLERELGGRVQVLNRSLLGANVAGSAVVAESASREHPDIILWAVSPAMLLETPDSIEPRPTHLPRWWRLGILFEKMLMTGRQAAMLSESRNGRIMARGGTPEAPGIRLMEGSLGLIFDAAQRAGSRVAGFIIPDFAQDRSYGLVTVHDQMGRVFAAWQVPVIDPVNAYRDSDTRMLRLDESHPVPGVQGHLLLAKEAAQGLRRLGLVP